MEFKYSYSSLLHTNGVLIGVLQKIRGCFSTHIYHIVFNYDQKAVPSDLNCYNNPNLGLVLQTFHQDTASREFPMKRSFK